MTRSTGFHQLKLATALLCALTAGQVLAQTAPAAGQAAATKPGSGFLPPASANAKVIDSIHVVVNDEVITKNEVRNRVAQTVQNLKARNVQLPDGATLERQVVEAMIVERAQIQLAKEMGVRVDDRQLDATIGRIAENQKLSVQELRNQMEKEGMAYSQFRDDIRNEIMMQRLREHEVDSKIQVSEAEIDTYLTASKAAAADKVEMNLAQILVAVPENASPEQIAARRARADEVARQLRTGADFAKMAATYSDAPDALKGGDIGWRDPDRLPPVFATELRKLKPGQVTGIIKTNVGFHILKMADQRSLADAAAADKEVVQQTRVSHILMKPNPTMNAAEVKKKLLELRQKVLDKSATFEDLARQNSQEPGSAAKGGDLGWLEPGDAGPEFDQALASLKPGEISDVIESPFGFHILRVVERKSEDQSAQKERNTARQVLRERKLQEAMEDWMRQVRDRAYVEFREEQ
ncbi:peptidylprolyl isomerase [Massilia sp. IC2-477]|uniref:peptidylprolyl isomerase n=1 Tax=unclassified Massilia TaxID=2609279 RepID=UPI001D110418|nr:MULTISPECIES: peptidylprolyl isomerase [unclassified Massilia]MCC2957989.1 peptidylprolyl isomerase [Massilia sp. IC2-477]MCC2973450.1 peptidylprolyl isomerase [Massilia sp. IC2-476]